MKYFFKTIIVACFFSTTAFSQINPCGTPPGKSAFLKDYQAGKYGQVRDGDEWLVLPVQIHITGEDDGTGRTSTRDIGLAFQGMNAAFHQAKIQFFLADEYLYIDNSVWHNHTRFFDGYDMMEANNLPNVINVYVCENAANNCGYYSPSRDAVVMNNSCLDLENQTLAHELGHFLSLPHPFDGWEGEDYDNSLPTPEFVNGAPTEKTDGSNCQFAGDGFCDTPPDYLSFRWPCNANGESDVLQFDADGIPFRSDGSIIMGYSTGDCRTWFSGDQVDAMCANITFSRQELLNHSREYQELPDCQTVKIVYPANRDTIHYEEATLRWRDIPGVDYFRIQVAKNLNFTDLVVDAQINDSFYHVQNLDLGRLHFWRVEAHAAHSPCLRATTKSWIYVEDLSVTTQISDNQNIEANISNNTLIIELSDNFQDELQLSLFGIDGQMHLSEVMVVGQTSLRRKVGALGPGVYMLHIRGGKFEGVLKLHNIKD